MRNFGYTEDGKVGSLADFHLWKRILIYCQGALLPLSGGVALSLIITAATLILPILLRNGIDQFMLGEALTGRERLAGLSRLAMGYAALSALIFACSLVQAVLLETVAQQVMHLLRQNLFAHLLDMDQTFYHKQDTGRLVTRLTNDIQNMHEMFTSVVVTLFNDLLRLAGILVILVVMSPRLGLGMVVYLPLALGATHLFSRLARDRFRALRRTLSRLNGSMQEVISGLVVVQLAGATEYVQAQYAGLCREFVRRALAQIRLFAFFLPLTEFMAATATAIILYSGGRLILLGELTPGELVAFLSYMRLFFQPVRELSQKYSVVQSALASAERIFQTLDRKSRLTILPPVCDPVRITGYMAMKGVCFSYEPGETILHDIDLELVPGQVVALVGATGSGKSTLAALLVRFYDPDKGAILLDGVDLRHYPLRTLRCHVGLIMQEGMIFPGSVRENVLAGSDLSEEELNRLSRETGLDLLVDRLPEGMDTRIGEGGIEMSAGERQVVGFARILARDPTVLIFDEATAALDACGESLLERALARGYGNRSILIIAHRLASIHHADVILVMDRGRIVERGTHRELMNRCGVYAKLVATDARYQMSDNRDRERGKMFSGAEEDGKKDA